MQHELAVFACDDDFGSVACCSHGCIHVQVGATTITLSKEQYLRFVVMIADSAANYEQFRLNQAEPDPEENDYAPSEDSGADALGSR